MGLQVSMSGYALQHGCKWILEKEHRHILNKFKQTKWHQKVLTYCKT